MTNDCVVNLDDIAPFAAVFVGNENSPTLQAAADVDGNGRVDGLDVDAFLTQIINTAQCDVCETLGSGFAGGSGTPADPYQICNATQLQRVDDFLNANFILVNDIDLAGINWTPIGFTTFGDSVIHYDGVFDGNHHRVRNLSIQQSNTDVIGLFGKLGPNAIVRDLGVENVDLHGKLCVGGFAAENDGLIERCYVTGTVQGATFVGGFVGDNRALMQDCYAMVETTGSSSVGGFAGVSFLSPTYVRCYSTGRVIGSSSTGGLVGSTIGSHTVLSCYWDTQTSTTNASAGGDGKTTAQMKQQSTYSGWDFSSIWQITPNTYPRLRWE